VTGFDRSVFAVRADLGRAGPLDDKAAAVPFFGFSAYRDTDETRKTLVSELAWLLAMALS